MANGEKKLLVKSARLLLVIVYFTGLCHHCYLLYFGKASVFSTLFFYSAFFLLIDRLLIMLGTGSWKTSNWRITYWTVFIGLIAGEFILRYVSGSYQSYLEQNGAFYYSSKYRQVLEESIIRRKEWKQEDVRLWIKNPGERYLDDKPEFQYVYNYNGFGLRAQSYKPEDFQSKKLVVAMGDSFTEGYGAPEDSTWLLQFLDLIQTKYPDIIGINAGIAGSDVIYEYLKLEEIILKNYDPSLVILVVNTSDIHDIMVRGGMERFVSKDKVVYRDPPWWEYIYAFSYITRGFIHGILGYGHLFYRPQKMEVEEMKAENIICDCLIDNFYQRSKADSFDFHVVFSPMQYELEYNIKRFVNCKKRLSTHHIDYIDLYPVLKEEDYQNLYWQTDLHHNSKGYGFWARVIRDSLSQDLANRLFNKEDTLQSVKE